MKFILLVMLFLTGCANKFRQEMLADGKTWRVESPRLRCTSSKAVNCEERLDADVTEHAKVLCNGPTFRLFLCEKDISLHFAHKECMLECKPDQRAPATTP